MRDLGLTALVVDDNRAVVRIVATLLERRGFQVLTAHDGAEGLAKAMNELPDLMILDVLMPKMNGYEVARRLQDDPATAAIPIIMLTVKGRVDEDGLDEDEMGQRVKERLRGFEAGAVDFLSKPVKAREMLERVERLLWWDLPHEST